MKDKAKVAALHVKGSSLPNVAKINYYFCIERKTQPASGKTQTRSFYNETNNKIPYMQKKAPVKH